MLGLPAAVFSGLLVVTGIVKLRRPGDTARALAVLGFPNRSYLGSWIGATELGVGLAVLMTSSRVAWVAQTVAYAAFAAWVIMALARDVPLASCGCLGTDDTPPYWGHVVMDVSAAALSLGAALESPPPFWTGTAVEVAVYMSIIGVGCFLSWLVIGDAARVRVTYAK